MNRVRAATLLCLFFTFSAAPAPAQTVPAQTVPAQTVPAQTVPAETAPAQPVPAQTVPLEVEFGYRFLDLTGSREMYRSQIDERQGFLLRSLRFATIEPDGHGMLFDRMTFDATDIGVGPSGGFRMEIGRGDLYRLRTSYEKTEMYSALPALANPLLDQGIVPGQHTYDRERHRFDADFELFPGGVITPIVGYSRNSYSGPGTTTATVGQDEFLLTQDLRTLDEEIRGGASFQAGPISGQVIQGWRKFSSHERLTLAPGAANGNNSGPILGLPVLATGFNRQTDTEVDTPATSAVVTGRFAGRIRVVGSYTSARGSSDSVEQEDGTGNFVSFELGRFFRGFSEPITSRSTATQWTGLGRVEVGIVDGVDFEASYTRRHRELDGFALISTVLMNTSTFGNVSAADVARLLEANTAIERTENVYEAGVAARGLGPFSLRGSYSKTDQDLTVTADPSEIVVPGGQGGNFDRSVKTFDIATTYAAHGFTVGGEYRNDKGSTAIVRTDFTDRDRYRLRAAWSYKELVRLSATAEQIDVQNDDPTVALDGRVRRYGGDIDVKPSKPWHLRFSASKYQADNTTLIRRPEDFSTEPSVHREDGTSIETSAGYTAANVELEGGYGRFENKGVFPFVVDRVRFHAAVPLSASFSGIFEWSRDKYSEKAITPNNLGNYFASRYGVYVRWHL